MTNLFSYNILTFVLAWLSKYLQFFKVIYLGPWASDCKKGVNL
jgi:hypothetical protein